MMADSTDLDYWPSYDRAFLLRLLAKANPRGHHMGAVKPNKFTFLVSQKALQAGLPGFRYRFIKDRLGPKSVSVYTDLGRLSASGMINSDGAVSARGQATLVALAPFFEAEPRFTAIVDEVARSHGHIPRHILVDKVHGMVVTLEGREVPIEEAPQGCVLLDPSVVGASRTFDEAWGETLETVFDPEMQAKIAASREDVASGRTHPFDPVRD